LLRFSLCGEHLAESRRNAAKKSARLAASRKALTAKAEPAAKSAVKRKPAVKSAMKPKSATPEVVIKKVITKKKKIKKAAALSTPTTPTTPAQTDEIAVEDELQFLSSPPVRKRSATPFDVEKVKAELQAEQDETKANLQAQFAAEHYQNEDSFITVFQDIGKLLGQRREYATAISGILERLAVLERRDEARQRPPEPEPILQRRRRSRSRSRSRYEDQERGRRGR